MVNKADRIFKKAPLILSAMRGNLEISELLFSKGAEINERDKKGDQYIILMQL